MMNPVDGIVMLPCPFCGGSAEVRIDSDKKFYPACKDDTGCLSDDGTAYRHGCVLANIQPDGEYGHVVYQFASEVEAARAWNKRAAKGNV